MVAVSLVNITKFEYNKLVQNYCRGRLSS